MKVKWSGIVAVALVVMAIITYKVHIRPEIVPDGNGRPTVLLVADLSEAHSSDACAEIIRSVRAARERGIRVQELSPDGKSEMLHRYRVLTIPTVLILDRTGEVVSRFEGEDRKTIAEIRTQLARLR